MHRGSAVLIIPHGSSPLRPAARATGGAAYTPNNMDKTAVGRHVTGKNVQRRKSDHTWAKKNFSAVRDR